MSGGFSNQADCQPHRVEDWLNAKPDAPVAFAAQVTAVWEVYQHAPAIAEHGGPGIRTAEKTGRQALARAAPTLPRPPGVVERPAYAYRRHGTQCLSATCNVATGEVVAPTVGPSRTAEDCAGPIAHTIATAPAASGLFSVDPLHRHPSAALVRLVAAACGLQEDLGAKEQRGIGQSRATRAEFLSDGSHRIRFMYTPKHTSGLNQIELWLRIVVRRLLKRGHFTSVED